MDRAFVDACAGGDVAQADSLLIRGARLNAVIPDYWDGLGYSGMAMAICCGRPHMVRYLLDAGADPNEINEGQPALVDAFLYGRVACAKVLISGKANPLLLGEDGGSILHAAVMSDNIAAVKLALEYDSRLDLVDRSGNTPFALAQSLKYPNGNAIVHLLNPGKTGQ